MTELQRCELAKEKGFTYNPETGEIRGAKGNVIKRKHTYGYICCALIHNDKKYNIRGHRLGWFLHYGTLPTNQLDHIDGNRTNNRIENLRNVNNQQNHFNMTKAKGYHWHKATNKFKAEIMKNGKNIFLGLFDDPLEARAAYLEAKKKYHVIS